jgi:hypothetical protein
MANTELEIIKTVAPVNIYNDFTDLLSSLATNATVANNEITIPYMSTGISISPTVLFMNRKTRINNTINGIYVVKILLNENFMILLSTILMK